MVRIVIVLCLLASPAIGAVPDDLRLSRVRLQIEEVFAAAARDGVPEAILADKVREGLAKSVPPEGLAQAIRTYEGRLAEAVTLAGASLPSLLKAVAEARAVGAEPRELRQILAASHDPKWQTRALDVVTDLAQRGLPVARVASTVASVLRTDPRKLERIAFAAHSLSGKVGGAEALEAISRATGNPYGLDRADFTGHPDDRGPDRDTEGQRGPAYQHGKGQP
jgi:hypothetical protein